MNYVPLYGGTVWQVLEPLERSSHWTKWVAGLYLMDQVLAQTLCSHLPLRCEQTYPQDRCSWTGGVLPMNRGCPPQEQVLSSPLTTAVLLMKQELLSPWTGAVIPMNRSCCPHEQGVSSPEWSVPSQPWICDLKGIFALDLSSGILSQQ